MPFAQADKQPIPLSGSASKNILSTSSLITGLLSIILCWFPFCGGVLPAVSVFLGILGLKTSRRTLSIIGIILGGLILIVNIIITVSLIINGISTDWFTK